MSASEDEVHLYIKVVCSLCLGGRRKGVFANCSYCNHERMTYIEAPITSIAKYVKTLDKETQSRFLDLFTGPPEHL